MPRHARNFFTLDQVQDIANAIAAAETRTSGEIRVRIEKKCKGDQLKRAAYWFDKMGMNKTEDRNGILIYLAVGSRVFAIFGDQGIHEKVTQSFWDEISRNMELKFKTEQFTEGIIEVIQRIGEKLQKYFPVKADNKNELSNEVSF